MTGTSLAQVLRYEHPVRGQDAQDMRSIDGIRFVNHGRGELHAVALGLDRLCDCRCGDDGMVEAVCSCFRVDDVRTRALYASKNNLTSDSIRALSCFRDLEVLSLADNRIDRVPEALRGMVHLKRFSLSGNPIIGPHVREKILAFRPTLKELNGQRVHEAEVRRAHAVYKEECILRNLVHLLESICTLEPGEAWVGALERIDRVMVGGIASLRQLADEYFLFDDDAKDVSSCNHGLAMIANTVWTRSVAFSMSDNVEDHDGMEPVLLEVTSALVSLESLCREKEGRRVADVEDLTMKIWKTFFEYRDFILRQRQEAADAGARAASAATPDLHEQVVTLPSSELDRISRERDNLLQESRMRQEELDILRSQRDGGLEQIVGLEQRADQLQKDLAASSLQNDTLRRQIEELVKVSRVEKDQVKQVMRMLSDQLEASKRRETTVCARNQALVEELDDSNRARAAASTALRQAERALVEAKEMAAAGLSEQKTSFEELIKAISAELEVARNEPRVFLNIEVVNTDVPRLLEELDTCRATVSRLQAEVASNREDARMNIRAEAYRQESVRKRGLLAVSHCFWGWLAHRRRCRALEALESCMNKMEAANRRDTAIAALRAWLAQSTRSKAVVRLGAVHHAQAISETLRRVLYAWSCLTARSTRVQAFRRVRSERILRGAFNRLAEHAINRRTARRSVEFRALNGYKTTLVTETFRFWSSTASSRASVRASVANCLQQATVSNRTKLAFVTWLRITRDTKRDILNQTAANRLADRTLKGRALYAMQSYTSNMLARREQVEALEKVRGKETMSVILNGWRGYVELDRAARMRLAIRERDTKRCIIAAWREHLFRTNKASVSELQSANAILQRRLCEEIEASRRKDARALDMAASCDTLCSKLSDAQERHRKVLSCLREKQSRILKKKRVLGKELSRSVKGRQEMITALGQLDAKCMQYEQSLETLRCALQRSVDENRNLKLRLRAADAVKSSAQTRAMKHMFGSEDWRLSAGRL